MHNGSRGDYEQLLPLLNEIRLQASRIEPLTLRLRSVIEKMEASSAANQMTGQFWKAVVIADSLVRVRLFIEQNFNYIETMSLLAVSRYLFELTVWLKLLQQDGRYGLVYYYELLNNKRRFYEALQKQTEREISFLQNMEKTERQMLEGAIAYVMQGPQKEQEVALKRAMMEVPRKCDEEAARRFSLYAEQARQNGYGFQAYLVEKKGAGHCNLNYTPIG